MTTYYVYYATGDSLPVTGEMEIDVPADVAPDKLGAYLLQAVCDLEEIDPERTWLLGYEPLDEDGEPLGDGIDYSADAMAARGEDDISDVDDGSYTEAEMESPEFCAGVAAFKVKISEAAVALNPDKGTYWQAIHEHARDFLLADKGEEAADKYMEVLKTFTDWLFKQEKAA